MRISAPALTVLSFFAGVAIVIGCRDVVVDQDSLMKPLRATISLDTTANLQHEIDTAQSGDVLELAAGTYHIWSRSGLTIHNHQPLTIHGSGPSTVIKLSDTTLYGFLLDGNESAITISNLSIEGSLTENSATREAGIVTGRNEGDNTSTLRDLAFTDLDIHNVYRGIKVGLGIDSGRACDYVDAYLVDSVLIARNTIHDIYGSEGASGIEGYGINNANGRDVRIEDNVIAGVKRHAIYQSNGCAPVLIKHNLILNHGGSDDTKCEQNVGIVISRSSDVTAIANVIVNSYNRAMSVEPVGIGVDTLGQGSTPARIYLINNVFLGSRTSSLWIEGSVADNAVLGWGNRFLSRSYTGDPVVKAYNGSPPCGGTLTTSYSLTGPSYWAGTQAIASESGDTLFVVQNVAQHNYLHRVTPTSFFEHPNNTDAWLYTFSNTHWDPSFQALTTSDNGHVWVMQNNALHRVTAEDWSYAFTDGWYPFQAFAAVGSYLYIIATDSLLRKLNTSLSTVATNTNAHWFDTEGMAAWKDSLYILQNDCVHSVSASDLTYQLMDC